MNLKNYKEEIIFIFVILLVISIWRMIELFKDNRNRNNTIIKEGMVAEEGMTPEERKDTEKIISQTDKILAEANNLIKEKTLNATPPTTNGFRIQRESFISMSQIINSATKLLTSEDYGNNTSENVMTVNQRMHSATLMDHKPQFSIDPPKTKTNTTNTTIEGLENKDDKNVIPVKITSLSDTPENKFKLRDYYIKSSYNTFNDGDFDYSTVSMDACLYALSRGCRFIDFEVYSIDNVPVIASSSENEYTTKKSKNSIPVSEAFEVLGNYAFSSAKCPNHEDPFIIHMRIMSQNITMYHKLEDVIKNSKSVASRLLGPKYGMDYQSNDLGNENLLDFKNKIILMVDGTNPIYKKTGFYQFVNMSSNTLFLSKKTVFDVKNIADPQQYKEANKKNMALVLPEKSGKPKNDGHNGPYTWGAQIVAMCFQESARNEKLDAYEKSFDAVGFAYVLKPKDLRYIPITIAPPKPPNPNSSFEGKPASAPGIGALPPF
jgi:hypothetical protein